LAFPSQILSAIVAEFWQYEMNGISKPPTESLRILEKGFMTNWGVAALPFLPNPWFSAQNGKVFSQAGRFLNHGVEKTKAARRRFHGKLDTLLMAIVIQ